MIDVKYTIRGFELYDVNPKFVSDLERVTSKLFNASVSFPDFNAYEESMGLMHGVTKSDGVHPESPWAKARFRFDKETRINSLQGILIIPSGNEGTYVQLADKIPEIAANAERHSYDSSLLWRLNEKHVRGKSVERMVIDRGKEYDSVTLNLNDGTETIFVYKQGTFIGFEIDESAGRGIKSTHYILKDVDPSIYVPGFVECFAERKDVIFNEGLMGGTTKPLLVGTKVSYRKPNREHIEVMEANRGDQYIVIFEAESPEKAQKVYSLFRKTFEDRSKADSQIPFSVDALAQRLGSNISVKDFPKFAVYLTKDRNPGSKYYGLTLTTLSMGPFKTQNDLRCYLQGSVVGIKLKAEVNRMELI